MTRGGENFVLKVAGKSAEGVRLADSMQRLDGFRPILVGH
jgi:hypothetical protein